MAYLPQVILWDDDMAFQMIPPRLSSSPPPLDSLPTVACPGEEDYDDEFGSFSTHNASFDITGLSDKLPPTPDTSPSKLAPAGHGTGHILPSFLEGVRDDNISQDSGVGSSNHPNEFSPQPQVDDHSFGDFSNSVTGVFKGNDESIDTVKSDDGDDFTNFQAFNSIASEPPRIHEPEHTGQGHGSSSSQTYSTVHEYPESVGRRSSRNSFSMIGTPPPLDYVANSATVEDEFSRFSSILSADNVSADNDEFGNFTSNKVSEIINGELSSTENERYNKSSPVPYNRENLTSEDLVKNRESSSLSRQENVSTVSSVNTINITSKANNIDENRGCSAEDDLHSGSSSKTHCVINESVSTCIKMCNEYSSQVSRTQDERLNVGSEALSTTTLQTENTSTVILNQKDEIASVCSSDVSEKIKSEFMHVKNAGNVQENQYIKVIGTFESADTHWENELEEKCELKVIGCDHGTDNECINCTHLSGEKNNAENYSGSKSYISACNSGDNFSSEVRTENRTTKEENGEIQCNKSYRMKSNDIAVLEEHCSDDFGDFNMVDSQSESDFGDFSKANDDDDLDFADLRAQVESGTFGTGEMVQPAPEDVGTFCDINTKSVNVEDEFGDFNASTAIIDSEFGDFDSADIGDEFGDFAVHETQSASVNLTCGQKYGLEDDFGDFSSPEDARDFGNFTRVGGEREPSMGDFSTSWKENYFGTSCSSSPVLRKLESLVLKWIPKGKTAFSLQEEQPVPTLHQAVESDAFVWRQLENLEASAALTLTWGNTQAHNFFLSSVNVDARNILFGQKWSSSVPLFAQTLSFSPLTPAKSTEGSGGAAVALSGCSNREPTPTSTTITDVSSQQQLKKEEQIQVPSTKDGSSEEQIPPAKFDWTSSGLTNPLEVPAYNSSLFGLDLLLTNTSIGKGATNALLASLEREFLSEGGEKGSNIRIKSPPTPSPLVQQILGSGLTKDCVTNTPLQSLVPEVRQVVEHLPDLGFMRSKVLMFPIRGEQ
nr:aftiphilin-like isoform X2 [Procambarus clarkii]